MSAFDTFTFQLTIKTESSGKGSQLRSARSATGGPTVVRHRASCARLLESVIKEIPLPGCSRSRTEVLLQPRFAVNDFESESPHAASKSRSKAANRMTRGSCEF